MACLITPAYLVAPGAEVYLSRVIKLLVFDLDGTLVDTRLDLANSVNHALVQAGYAAIPVETIIGAVGDGSRNLIERCLKTSQNGRPPLQSQTDAVHSAFLAHYQEHCLVESVVYPGVAAALEKLAGYRKAVLTNKPDRPAHRVLAGLNLARHFEWILGGDNAFGQKPDPAALKHILDSAGATADQAAMIGDGVQDIKAARGAGIHFIGFLAGIGDRQTLLAEQPESILEDMHSLPAAVAALDSFVGDRSPATGGRV